MEEFIRLENIKVNVEATDWEDAIRKAGELLEQSGSIKTAYIDNMINSVKTLGPYIVLMPGFALGHSEPCPEVIKSDLSLITLKNPINFGSMNDPVKVVMCLACVDKQEHMAGIQRVAMKLMQENAIENMLKCDSDEELYKYMNE